MSRVETISSLALVRAIRDRERAAQGILARAWAYLTRGRVER